MKTKTSLIAGLTMSLLFAAAWTAAAIDFSVPDIPQQLTDAQKEANKAEAASKANPTPTPRVVFHPSDTSSTSTSHVPGDYLETPPSKTSTSNVPNHWYGRYTNQGTASKTSNDYKNHPQSGPHHYKKAVKKASKERAAADQALGQTQYELRNHALAPRKEDYVNFQQAANRAATAQAAEQAAKERASQQKNKHHHGNHHDQNQGND